MDSDTGTKSSELGKTELMTIAQSILYASEYSNGKSDTAKLYQSCLFQKYVLEYRLKFQESAVK